MTIAEIVAAARACEQFAEYARSHLAQIEHDSRDRSEIEAVLTKKSKTASAKLIAMRRKYTLDISRNVM